MAGIKFRMKDFREREKIFQGEIASVLGINQSSISRIENKDKELTGYQYDLLCAKYGADKVSKYVDEESVRNAVSSSLKSNPRGVVNDDALAIIKEQQQEIARLNKRIEELTNIIINKQ